MSAPSGSGEQGRPASPPSRADVERKLSVKSAARPDLSPKKKMTTRLPVSGNESDSSVASAVPPAFPASPILSPSVGGTLSAIAETHGTRSRSGGGSVGVVEEEIEGDDEADLEGGEDAEGDDGESDEMDERENDLRQGMEGERVIKSGFLWKKQQRRKQWKRKWFVLRTNKLAYYKDEREYSLSRVIDLPSVHTVAPVTVKKHSFAFGIVTSKRTFFAKASSADEMDEWVRAINGARRRMSERAEEDARRARDKDAPAQTHPPGAAAPSQPGALASPSMSMRSPTSPRDETSATSYFVSRQGSPNVPSTLLGANMPASPMDTTNTLTSQLAGLAVRSPMVASGSGAAPSGSAPAPSAAAINRRLSNPIVPPQLKGRSPSVRRDPSVASDHAALAAPPQSQAALSSDDEEDAYFSDPHAAFVNAASGSPVVATSPTMQQGQAAQEASGSSGSVVADPKKVILAAYLTKRSKWRGRKVWKKRWFVLTSQGLSYCKSHMPRFIPLSSILDAIDTDTSSSGGEGPSLTRSPTQKSRHKTGREHERIFRVITSTRTYVLCAPSEEDIIKWIAAVRALLNRERAASSAGAGGAAGAVQPSHLSGSSAGAGSGMLSSTAVLSPAAEGTPQHGQHPGHIEVPHVPSITQQPPTPGTPATAAPANAGSTATAPAEVVGGPQRGATYTAKTAVADAARRFNETAA